MGEWVSGNIFIRTSGFLNTGDAVEGHTHNFDHTTIVFRGAVRVEKSVARTDVTGAVLHDEAGQLILVQIMRRDFAAPAHFLIEANAHHKITALEDNTVYWCVYSHRNPQGDVVQEWDGWEAGTG